MPKISEMFPSKYISGSDLNGKPFVLVIAGVTQEEMFDVQMQKKTRKWVLYFKDAKKGLLLGKTQAKEVADIVQSEDTDGWKGKKVEIYPTQIKAFGKRFTAVRFRKPSTDKMQQIPSTFQDDVEDEMPEISMDEVPEENELEIILACDILIKELTEIPGRAGLTANALEEWAELNRDKIENLPEDLHKKLGAEYKKVSQAIREKLAK